MKILLGALSVLLFFGMIGSDDKEQKNFTYAFMTTITSIVILSIFS